MITLSRTDSLDAARDAAASALAAGQAVVLPTDTVYGLACSPSDPAAADEVYRLKQRPRERRLPVIVADAEQARALGVRWTAAADALAAAFWPGALTLAVGLTAEAPGWLAGRDEVALRAPGDELTRAIAATFGPFLMTSANPHGQATAPSLREVLDSLHGEPAVAIDGGELDVVASTLVNVNLDAPEIAREGAVPAAEVERVLAGG
ncbi:MAG TPA: L-threonylcarbamoyladenylate synthase [Capillimicrobium sp.]|jgi:L-threonylcarbamoyladenylate synthase